MINQQLLNYVFKTIRDGYAPEQINRELLKEGWSPEEIDQALFNIQEMRRMKSSALSAPPAPRKPISHKDSLLSSQILLYLGGLIMILAGIIYVSIHWDQWHATGRIVSILLPMILCYGVGTVIFSRLQKWQGLVFLVVGSLLFPLFLWVMFEELAIFPSSSKDHLHLTISLLSFILYLTSNFVFRCPIWALLYQCAGIFLYYFVLRLVGVDNFLKKATMAWMYCILGAVYLFLSYLHLRKHKNHEADYFYFFGIVILIGSFTRLWIESFDYQKHNVAWFLVSFGLTCFLAAIVIEKNKLKEYYRTLYVVGASVIFFSLIRLSMDGSLLSPLVENIRVHNRDVIGWSNMMVGVIYLMFAYAIEKIKHIRLEKILRYKDLFHFLGAFWILGALFYLGLDDHKPMYETLLLLFSLGFIFGSIPKMIWQYLFVGACFLILYIFSIGGEYFQNKVGWPITLFIAGFSSMIISIGIDRFRRKYFSHVKS